ncbi:MAG: TonB-dependent receptor, partial [Bacteroidota bacterium]
APTAQAGRAKPFRQVHVQLTEQAATLPEIFAQLEEQTPYAFAYSTDVLADESRYRLPKTEGNLLALLEELTQQARLIIHRRNFNVSVKKSPVTETSPQLTEETVRFTISGFVREAASGEGLLGATVYDRQSGEGTVTNTYGFFSLSVPEGPVSLECSFVGLAPQATAFELSQDTTLSFRLTNAIQLEEVVVESQYPLHEINQMSSLALDMKEVSQLPAFFGEVDLFKTMQLMPGVAGGLEGTSGLHVRGGTPDQNLILLDGAPVYNINHLFGIFSVFNPDAIKNAELIKGGFPARYGGRLASVMDITMKEGNSQEFHGVAAVGLISTKLTLEGPILTDKTSFILSGRRTLLDVFAEPLFALGLNPEHDRYRTGYFFHDLNAKINHRFSDRNQVFLSFYGGKDSFYLETRDDIPAREADPQTGQEAQLAQRTEVRQGLDWANRTATLRWNSMLHPKLFLHSMLTYSEFDLTTEEYFWEETDYPDTTATSFFDLDYRSGIQDYSAKVALEYLPVPGHEIRVGGLATRHRFIPGARTFHTQRSGLYSVAEDSVGAWEFAVYAEDNLSLGKHFGANVGAHFSAFQVNGTTYTSVQPRLSTRVLVAPRTSVKASFSTMTQYLHLLTNIGVALPTDMWVPVTDRVAPQQAVQYGLGITHTHPKGYEFSLEGYYRTADQVIEYQESAGVFDAALSWQDRITVGRSWMYGGELLLRKTRGAFTGWLAYTLAWSWRQFDEINRGQAYPFRYDRRHDLSVVGMYNINERISLSGAWTFTSGAPFTPALSESRGPWISEELSPTGVNPDGSSLTSYHTDYLSPRNAYRGPAHHRLDLSATFRKQKKRGERAWIVSVYNAYNRTNPFLLVAAESELTPTKGREYLVLGLLPIIPSVTYQFTF